MWASGLRALGVWGFFLVEFCSVLGCLGFSFACST